MSAIITRVEAIDVRFPTSRALAGSDAMNPDPDYSAAYAIVHTSVDGLEGHGFTFTIGRGNELCVAAIEAYAPALVGLSLEQITDDMGLVWRKLTGDSQMRWLGPEKGVVHLAAAALINALWDLLAKRSGKPLWRLLADLEPERLAALLCYRHIGDALSPAEAREIAEEARRRRGEILPVLEAEGYPAYTTSAGWLGYGEDKLVSLCRAAADEGWNALKFKVGVDLAADRRRCALAREAIGDRLLMIDANQVWEVGEAADWVRALSEFSPYWIEEPVSPDDILGHAAVRRAVAPVKVASGEHAANRVIFKQMLQAEALDVVQFDACRLAGVNEALTVFFLAAKFGKPVCQHAGGVGLCEVGQHLAVADALCVSGSLDGRMLEHAGNLHEHFVDPIAIRRGRYSLPARAGFSTEMRADSLARHRFPHGAAWTVPPASREAFG